MLPNDQLLEHSNSDDDEPENRAGVITIEDISDEDIQPIQIGGQTASVEVRCYSFLCLSIHLYQCITQNDSMSEVFISRLSLVHNILACNMM